MSEPVFIAASVAEIDLAEKLLEAEGIEYEVRPEASVDVGGVCMQGLLFEVPAAHAIRCRALFAERGLGRGVVGG